VKNAIALPIPVHSPAASVTRKARATGSSE